MASFADIRLVSKCQHMLIRNVLISFETFIVSQTDIISAESHNETLKQFEMLFSCLNHAKTNRTVSVRALAKNNIGHAHTHAIIPCTNTSQTGKLSTSRADQQILTFNRAPCVHRHTHMEHSTVPNRTTATPTTKREKFNIFHTRERASELASGRAYRAPNRRRRRRRLLRSLARIAHITISRGLFANMHTHVRAHTRHNSPKGASTHTNTHTHSLYL